MHGGCDWMFIISRKGTGGGGEGGQTPLRSEAEKYTITAPDKLSSLAPCTTRAVQKKVSSHFEYLENRSGGLDVTWQPITDLTAHP